MKYNKTFRILGIIIILCLLVIAIPATPALAQTIYCTPTTGTAGTPITITGIGFTGYIGQTVYILFNYNAMASAVVSATGGISATFSVPSYTTAGLTPITVQHTTPTYTPANQIAIAYFTVTAREIVVTPLSGCVGDTITVSGTGFNVSSTVTIYFDTTAVITAITTATGTFSGTTFAVPESYRGTHTVKGSDASGDSPSINFTTLSKISAAPTSGAVGDTITVSGTGFAVSSSITFYFDAQSVSVGATATNTNGSFTNSTFAIPSSSRGSHTIRAQDASGNYATTSFAIGQRINITPISGAPGITVTVSGTGFSANTTITINYNTGEVPTSPAVINTGATGSFTASFNVPAGLAGTHPVEATDGSFFSDSANFVATADATISQTTSQASPGHVGMELTISGTGFIPNRVLKNGPESCF